VFDVVEATTSRSPLDSFGPIPGTLSIRLDGPAARTVVHLGGDLDIAGRATALMVCAAVVHRVVLVDMTDLAFMDCAGYGALIAARRVLEARGGSLTMWGDAGQPSRLRGLIDESEHRLAVPA
jgi:anti-anti-sigma factor